MNLSNTLSYNLANKLKLEISLIQKEKFYAKNLVNQVAYLKKLKENDFKNLNIKKYLLNNHKKVNFEDFMVIYVINIFFSKANTIVNISDIQGNLKLFYSAGSVQLGGKQKKKRRIAILKLMSLILKKAIFLNKTPIALHLNNINFYKKLIVQTLKRNLFIQAVKIFNQPPFNGCRRKKVRRKKHTKKFK